MRPVGEALMTSGTTWRSDSWRARRARLEAWVVAHAAELAAGRALVWVRDDAQARALARWAAWEHGLALAGAVRSTADIGRGILLAAGRPTATASPTEELAAVSTVLAGGEPARYAAYRARPRTCRTLLSTLALLRAEEPQPERWEARWADRVPHRRADLVALAQLEQRLRAELSRRHYTPRAVLELAAAELVTPPRLGCDHLLLHEPTAFSAADRVLLAAVLGAGGVGRCEAILPAAAADAEPAALRLVRESLRAAGCDETRDAPAEAGLVTARWQVATPHRGLTAVFREVKELLLAEPELDPSRVVVVLPDAARWASVIDTLGEEYGLPVTQTAGPPARLKDEAATALDCLAAVAAEFPRRAVVALLDRHPEGFAPDDVAALDLVSRQANLVAGPWARWAEEIAQLKRVVPARDRASDEQLAQAEALVRRLDGLFGDTGPAHPARWRERLAVWLKTLAMKGEWAKLAPLAALDAWPDEARLAAAEYAALAADLLAEATPPPGWQPGHVLVTAPDALVGPAPRRLYVLNPLAGVFPASARDALPLDASDLSAMDLVAGESERGLTGRAAALAWRDLLGAAPEVVVVQPLTDAEGRPAPGSPLLDELPPGPLVRLPAERRLVAPEAALSVGEWVAGVLAGAACAAVPAQATTLLARAADGAAAELAARAGLCAPLVDAGERFGPEYRFSPTRLETYHRWPFAFFAAECLGLTSDEEPTGALDLRTEGVLLHRLLRGAVPLGEVLDGDAAQDRVAAVAARVLGDDRRWPGLSLGLWRRVRAQLTRWAQAVLAYEAALGAGWPTGRVPRYAELAFGAGTSWPALVLDAPSGRAGVVGRLDRVDETAAGWVVLDYKRTPAGKPGELAADALQLPLYAAALQAATGRDVVGWAYLGYRQPHRSSGQAMAPAALATVTGAALAAAVAAVEGIRAGRFPARPAPAPEEHRPDWVLRALARVAEDVAPGGDE